VKKVEIGHSLEGKRAVRLRQISRKLQRLWEVIFSRLRIRCGRHHKRKFKKLSLSSSKKAVIPLSRNGCGKQPKENMQREELQQKDANDEKRFLRLLMRLLCLKVEEDHNHAKQEPLNHVSLHQARTLHVISHQPCQSRRQKGLLLLDGNRQPLTHVQE
jgi:hypothetical protein